MHSNVMCDLETLGSGPDSKIISIGAVSFGKDGLGEEFYRVIDTEKSGGSISSATVVWWMQQNEAARSVFKSKEKISELLALMEFQIYANSVCTMKELKLWGNGSDFDNVILKSSFDRNRLQPPWLYYNNRCYRTYKAMFPAIEYVATGTKHNALADAKSQAEHMVKILNR